MKTTEDELDSFIFEKNWKKILIKGTVIIGVGAVFLLFMPKVSLATTGLLLKEKSKKKILDTVVQEKLPQIVEEVTKKTPLIKSVGHALKNSFIELKVSKVLNTFVNFQKEKTISSVIEKVIVPETFQAVTRTKIQPLLSNSELKTKTATIGAAILATRGGGFIEKAGTVLLQKLIGSALPPEDIWGGESTQKKKNKIFIPEIVTVSSYFAPAILVIGILSYFLGNPTNEKGRQKSSKRNQRTPGILNKGKRLLDTIKTILVGAPIEEETNFEESFGRKILGIGIFLMQNKIFSGISLLAFILLIFGHKLNPSTNIYTLLSESQKLVYTYSEKLWNKVIGEIKSSSLEIIRSLERQQLKTQENLDKCSSKSNEVEKELRQKETNFLKCELEKTEVENEIERRILDTTELQGSYTDLQESYAELFDVARKTVGADTTEILAIDEAKEKKKTLRNLARKTCKNFIYKYTPYKDQINNFDEWETNLGPRKKNDLIGAITLFFYNWAKTKAENNYELFGPGGSSQ